MENRISAEHTNDFSFFDVCVKGSIPSILLGLVNKEAINKEPSLLNKVKEMVTKSKGPIASEPPTSP